MFSKLPILLTSIFLLSKGLSTQMSGVCQDVVGLGNPVNIFHKYFQQVITMMDPKNTASQVWLAYYREQKMQGSYHRFIFRVKYQFRSKISWVGIVSFVPEKEFDNKKYTHFVVRYIDSARLEDVISLLGVYDFYKQDTTKVLRCQQLKENALNYLSKSQISNKCRSIKIEGCVQGSDLTRIFQANFRFIQNALKDFKFGVSLGEMGFNKTLLKIYRDSFSRYPFIQKAVLQLEEMINNENEVNHEQLVISSDLREKPKCQDILDLKEVCGQDQASECLSEKEARLLINYMITHYMVDTKTVLNPAIFEGESLCLLCGFETERSGNSRAAERQVTAAPGAQELGQHLVAQKHYQQSREPERKT